MFNTFKQPKNLAIGGLSIVVVALGLMALHNPTPVVPKAEASWAPEALSIVESIKSSGKDYKSASDEIEALQANLIEAQSKITRAEAAGKGADLLLCSKFQARFDRTTQTLISDQNCPLL